MSLEEVERIKQLKARYFRYIDTKQWEDWAMVFTADAVLDNPFARDTALNGRDEIVNTVRSSLLDAVTIHHGAMPEIEIVGDASARGIWAMTDLIIWPADGEHGIARYQGYGHYAERYVKETDGEWRIARLELRRLHVSTTAYRHGSSQRVAL